MPSQQPTASSSKQSPPRPKSRRTLGARDVTNADLCDVEDHPFTFPTRNPNRRSTDSNPTTRKPALDCSSKAKHTPPPSPPSQPAKRSKQSTSNAPKKRNTKPSASAVDLDSEYEFEVDSGSDSDRGYDEECGASTSYSLSDSDSSAPHTPYPEPNQYAYPYPQFPTYPSPFLQPYPAYSNGWNHTAAYPPYAGYNVNYDVASYTAAGLNFANHMTQLCLSIPGQVFNSDSGAAYGNTFSNINNDNRRIVLECGKKKKKKQTRTRRGAQHDDST